MKGESAIEFDLCFGTACFLAGFSKSRTLMETEILKQRAAVNLNVETSIVALSHEHAIELFNKATHRLLDVSRWHTLPCSLLTPIKLTDEKGREVSDRHAREEDYLVINNDHEGEEWVKVERIYSHRDLSGPREVITMRVRPGAHPFDSGRNSVRPSNTFKVVRRGLVITAYVYGQNEVDELNRFEWNFNEVDRPDSTVGAIPGVARVHWRSLVNGILSTWKE